jgi:RHS repeat-associated protein
MTDAAKVSKRDAVWLPWGGVHGVSGSATLDARFPGQWFQTETGLHYNWHRSYDPTLGRYTQPDPLGFVDGPSVYGYAGGSPHRFVDRDGRAAQTLAAGAAGTALCGPLFGAAAAGAAAVGGGYVLNQVIEYCMARPSDKERATDIPSWANGQKRRPDENCDEFAKRLLEENYKVGDPRITKRGLGSEHSKIKKFCERGGA